MKHEELKKEFESGSQMIETFYSRKNGYSIGSRKITKPQFDKIINAYEVGKINFELIVGGFTKHIYTFKKS